MLLIIALVFLSLHNQPSYFENEICGTPSRNFNNKVLSTHIPNVIESDKISSLISPEFKNNIPINNIYSFVPSLQGSPIKQSHEQMRIGETAKNNNIVLSGQHFINCGLLATILIRANSCHSWFNTIAVLAPSSLHRSLSGVEGRLKSTDFVDIFAMLRLTPYNLHLAPYNLHLVTII